MAHGWALFATAFLASALEFVEAATIVLAVSVTHGWRVALRGTLWALGVLFAIVAILGPALIAYVPIDVLKVAIGLFLILFGYTWLRKAIWRYGRRKDLHDEAAIFTRQVSTLSASDNRAAFAAAFNGVLLEGLEVAVIVITFGVAGGTAMLYAAAGAVAAGAIVVALAFALRAPLARVPENLLGFIVGIMLLTFGTFWSGEGLRVSWWSGDATLLWIAGGYLLVSGVLIGAFRNRHVAA
jgi:uncharacterized membrane protein